MVSRKDGLTAKEERDSISELEMDIASQSHVAVTSSNGSQFCQGREISVGAFVAAPPPPLFEACALAATPHPVAQTAWVGMHILQSRILLVKKHRAY